MARVLAITFDGILSPLGTSQVARVVVGLAARGFEYTVLSLERSADLRDATLVERMRVRLADAGVTWAPERYAEGGGARAIVENVARATRAARAIASRERIDLVHARAFHSGLVARALRATHGIPYLFDARGYWVDEQVEEGRRFVSPLSYRAAKEVERAIYRGASAVVTLTELHAGDVREGRTGARPGLPVVCIPTCADYDEFVPVEPGAPRPAALAGLPADARTVAIIGSLNRSYCVEETLALARRVLELDPRFHLVVLSGQRAEYERAIALAEIPAGRTLITSVPHHEIAAILPHLDWGLLLLRTNFAKRASVPTKLAELFACGVLIAQHGCNEEVSRWVERSEGGVVLPDLSPSRLDRTASTIVASRREEGLPGARAREVSAPHFSLRAGIERYAEVLARCA